MSNRKQTHTHKLKKHRYKSGNEIFFCILDCSYKVNPPLALGKKCICHRCDKEFIMTDYTIRLNYPHCEECHRPKGSKKTKIENTGILLDIEANDASSWVGPPSGEARVELQALVDLIEAKKRKDLGVIELTDSSIDSLAERLRKLDEDL